MADTTPNTCPTCLGTTEYPEGVICPTCLGRSTIPVKGLSFKVFKEQRESFASLSNQIDDVMDKCNDIKEKVDEIKDVVDAL